MDKLFLTKYLSYLGFITFKTYKRKICVLSCLKLFVISLISFFFFCNVVSVDSVDEMHKLVKPPSCIKANLCRGGDIIGFSNNFIKELTGYKLNLGVQIDSSNTALVSKLKDNVLKVKEVFNEFYDSVDLSLPSLYSILFSKSKKVSFPKLIPHVHNFDEHLKTILGKFDEEIISEEDMLKYWNSYDASLIKLVHDIRMNLREFIAVMELVHLCTILPPDKREHAIEMFDLSYFVNIFVFFKRNSSNNRYVEALTSNYFVFYNPVLVNASRRTDFVMINPIFYSLRETFKNLMLMDDTRLSLLNKNLTPETNTVQFRDDQLGNIICYFDGRSIGYLKSDGLVVSNDITVGVTGPNRSFYLTEAGGKRLGRMIKEDTKIGVYTGVDFNEKVHFSFFLNGALLKAYLYMLAFHPLNLGIVANSNQDNEGISDFLELLLGKDYDALFNFFNNHLMDNMILYYLNYIDSLNIMNADIDLMEVDVESLDRLCETTKFLIVSMKKYIGIKEYMEEALLLKKIDQSRILRDKRHFDLVKNTFGVISTMIAMIRAKNKNEPKRSKWYHRFIQWLYNLFNFLIGKKKTNEELKWRSKLYMELANMIYLFFKEVELSKHSTLILNKGKIASAMETLSNSDENRKTYSHMLEESNINLCS